MQKYYTRACNFYYNRTSIEKVKKKVSLPVGGNKLLSFDTIEIITRTNKKKLNIRSVKNLPLKIKKKVLTDKIDDLHKLAKALLTYETLTGQEIEDIVNKNLYPKNKEDLKVEEDDQSSALGSMGLKPKIVH